MRLCVFSRVGMTQFALRVDQGTRKMEEKGQEPLASISSRHVFTRFLHGQFALRPADQRRTTLIYSFRDLYHGRKLLDFRPACNRRSFSNVSVSVRILFAEIVTFSRQAQCFFVAMSVRKTNEFIWIGLVRARACRR